VVILADYFVRRIGVSMGKGNVGISPEAMGYLLNYTWPGNVRELKNIIERALILAPAREILPRHLPLEIRQSQFLPAAAGTARLRPLSEVEDEYITQILQITGNNHSRSAAILGMSRSTLLAKLKKIRL
jgi:two-component system, NtrC family, response regulator AtoC